MMKRLAAEKLVIGGGPGVSENMNKICKLVVVQEYTGVQVIGRSLPKVVHGD
jgi:hypothetical protein